MLKRLRQRSERRPGWLYRQGDVLLVPASKAPKRARPLERQQGRLVLAEGEASGHAHAVEDERAELVSAAAAAELYLLVHGDEPVELVHEEHSTLLIPPGCYRVVRQREWQGSSSFMVAD